MYLDYACHLFFDTLSQAVHQLGNLMRSFYRGLGSAGSDFAFDQFDSYSNDFCIVSCSP